MACRLRFPGAAELQGNAYQSGRISIKALNPSTLIVPCNSVGYRRHHFPKSKAVYYIKRHKNNDKL